MEAPGSGTAADSGEARAMDAYQARPARPMKVSSYANDARAISLSTSISKGFSSIASVRQW